MFFPSIIYDFFFYLAIAVESFNDHTGFSHFPYFTIVAYINFQRLPENGFAQYYEYEMKCPAIRNKPLEDNQGKEDFIIV